MNRKDFFKTLGLAAVVLPVIKKTKFPTNINKEVDEALMQNHFKELSIEDNLNGHLPFLQTFIFDDGRTYTRTTDGNGKHTDWDQIEQC